MRKENASFNEADVIHDLRHYLPAQAPLKDFIHHNTLHAFQHQRFFEGLRSASEIFGYKVSLTLDEYRAHFKQGKIREEVLNRVLAEEKGAGNQAHWKQVLLEKEYPNLGPPRIGKVRAGWKKFFRMDMDTLVHPLLFRILCSYLDQGIAIWNFPIRDKGFLNSVREMEKNSFSSYFRTGKGKKLLLDKSLTIKDLLSILIGDPALFEHYLFDQQFAHQGWSGMVAVIEDQPQTLLDPRPISLQDLIHFELLLEIDAVEAARKSQWLPLAGKFEHYPAPLFRPVEKSEHTEVFRLWQLAFEWSYYDEVLAGLSTIPATPETRSSKSFQAMFCIDDRECSIRRYLEHLDPECETFGTPGFFGVEFYFQPGNGKFYTKLCPAPVTPKYLVKELDTRQKQQTDLHFTKHAHSFHSGWLISQTLGFWSAFKLFLNIFRPSMSPATASSFRHMDKYARLTVENTSSGEVENGLQVGFTVEEMAIRVENLLKSIGLVKNFAPIVYVVGHGSSSVNNPHFAAYDCGACSGRAGSVNARVICFMANHPKVREVLASRGLVIPPSTQFVGGLHDTTRDEIQFFDEDTLTPENKNAHARNETKIGNALHLNAKERSRRFEYVPTHKKPEQVHEDVKIRSVSLFEPRPELNHATNALCIVGRRPLTRNLFLDRRSFLNSYDYQIDPEGNLLFNIIKPLGPVCGGINLEYFFSRVDNQKLGAGTKLPHNVMGLFGVANGIDGDLRPGLPSQMIEIHDPVRLLIIVEHYPEVVLRTVQKAQEVYEWFVNEWVNLAAVHPETREIFWFKEGAFASFRPMKASIPRAADLQTLFEKEHENIPVYLID